MQSNTVSTIDNKRSLKILSIAIAAAAGLALFYLLYPRLPFILDWTGIFAQLPAAWHNPYTITHFVNPPYIILFLPYAWLPIRLSTAINAVLNISVLIIANRKFKGGLFGLVLIFSSAYFIRLLANDNIDWIPLLGVMCPPWLGLILLSVKPQTLAGIGLIWLKKHGPKIFIPLVGVLIASLFIWRGWPLAWLHSSKDFFGYSIFPFLVPLGIFMLYKAWKSDDEILAAMATACFMPYFGLYSLTSVLAIAVSKYRTWAIALWVVGWLVIAGNILSVH